MVLRYKPLFFFVFGFLLSDPSIAQTKSPSISIQVRPDKADWKYNTGEHALFTICVQKDGKDINNVKAHIEAGQERMAPTVVLDTTMKGTVVIDGGTLWEPGFLRCIVTAEIDGKKYRGLATAGFSPESIIATAQTPPDFLSFWQQAIEQARKLPMDPQLNLIKERSKGSINVYEVSIQNFRGGSRIYGILCVPKKPGHYPALLKVPGAGVRPYKGDTALAEKGIITFEIGIHGIPVTMPTTVYYNLAFGALNDYYFNNLEDRDRYYYKRVYVGCVRAVDFLWTLPQADTSRLAVYGGSQGGALSIVTAALHDKIRYLVALYPALSDLTGYFHHRAGGWPHMFAPSQKGTFVKPEMLSTAAYYDVVNFARLLKVPGWFSWGFNDEVCPPTTSYAVYNSISSPKEIFITKETGHWLSPLQDAESTKWLLKRLSGAGK
ncbi:MAG TPA: acetylxylan esterase [Flavisolibacter sp.]|nr:acetylxylan esterase [Flavisolibacter sp.]